MALFKQELKWLFYTKYTQQEDPISPKTPIITVSLGTKHVGHLQVPSRGQRSTCRQKMKVKVQVQVAVEGVQWTQTNRFTGAP